MHTASHALGWVTTSRTPDSNPPDDPSRARPYPVHALKARKHIATSVRGSQR